MIDIESQYPLADDWNPGVPVIAFVASGGMGSGKTTAAQRLVHAHGFVYMPFAGPLKATAMQITPDGKIDKKRDRTLLQFLGTDYFRDCIDVDYWTKLWRRNVARALALPTAIYQGVVVDDMRFFSTSTPHGDNELQIVKALGGKVINIETPPWKRIQFLEARDGVAFTGISGHVTEQAFSPDAQWLDGTVRNNGTEAEFIAGVDSIVEMLKLTK